jgi:hypothetical protein
MSLEYYYFDNISYPIKVTTETTNIAHYTFPKGGKMWETKSIQQFFNVIPKEDTINIVDIGAQVGLYSLFAKFLPKSTFYAFEPFPATFKELNENIKLNNIIPRPPSPKKGDKRAESIIESIKARVKALILLLSHVFSTNRLVFNSSTLGSLVQSFSHGQSSGICLSIN